MRTAIPFMLLLGCVTSSTSGPHEIVACDTSYPNGWALTVSPGDPKVQCEAACERPPTMAEIEGTCLGTGKYATDIGGAFEFDGARGFCMPIVMRSNPGTETMTFVQCAP